LDIPSAHAANAHANVNPYAGADRAIVNPTPRIVAANADECPNAINDRVDADSSEPRDPFRLTNVAALVHPKCIVNGNSK
jgi:phosphoribosylformylglycinamidine (FGAM) synthase-like enzyme